MCVGEATLPLSVIQLVSVVPEHNISLMWGFTLKFDMYTLLSRILLIFDKKMKLCFWLFQRIYIDERFPEHKYWLIQILVQGSSLVANWPFFSLTQNSQLKFFSLLIIHLWDARSDIQRGVTLSSLSNLKNPRWPPIRPSAFKRFVKE